MPAPTDVTVSDEGGIYIPAMTYNDGQTLHVRAKLPAFLSVLKFQCAVLLEQAPSGVHEQPRRRQGNQQKEGKQVTRLTEPGNKKHGLPQKRRGNRTT